MTEAFPVDVPKPHTAASTQTAPASEDCNPLSLLSSLQKKKKKKKREEGKAVAGDVSPHMHTSNPVCFHVHGVEDSGPLSHH